ncbi:MAG TPA: ABC transporter permease [Vicinamibacterales bacterium]|nr:ABC transporter permease [Vicinamibacterales bacterium]
MSHDVRMAIRSLLRRPGFTAVAVLTLALAAGANTAVLAVVYGVLLKPLPFADPDRLVAVWPQRFQSNADLVYLREHAPMFGALATIAPGWTMALTGAGEPAKITVARVSGNLFGTLGVSPVIGRTFTDRDARRGADTVVLLSYTLWVQRFGKDPAVVGRVVRLEGLPFEVLGVMPPAFEVFGLRSDAYTPFALDPAAWYHQLSFSLFVARLAPEVTLARAEGDYRSLIPQLRRHRNYPDDYGRTAALQDLRSATVGDVSSSLVLVGAAVGLIMLIAGANVGTLLLIRAAGRSREMAVRAAVGASRARIARELLAESVLVAVAGGIAGLALARAALPALVALLPANTPRVGEIAIDRLVTSGMLGAAVLMGIAFGVAPALGAGRVRTGPLFRSGMASESRHNKRTRAALVSAEIALALVLTIGAGLMVQTLLRLQHVDPGFDVDRVLTLHLQPTYVGIKQSRSTSAYYDLVLERLRALPGVSAAGAIQHLPFSGYSWTAALDIQGLEVPAGTSRPTAGLRIATPGYFRSIGQPLVAGRDFVPQDAARLDAVIVNQALAKKHFGSTGAAVGGRLRIRGGGIQSAWMTVVGVVGDVRHDALTTDPAPEIYTSITQTSINAMMVAIRTPGDPLALVPAVREAIRSVDRQVPISDVQTMRAKVGTSLGRPRLMMVLLTGSAALGLLLAVVGVYGVVAYSVTRRRREIGIMLALGAGRGRIMAAVAAEALACAAAGLAVGIPSALAASGLMRAVVYGVSPTDPRTYAALALATVAVVAGACTLPALRAIRVDPAGALRSE